MATHNEIVVAPELSTLKDNPPPWHALSVDEALETLQSNARGGLQTAEASRRLEAWGPNTLPERQRPGAVQLVLRQFASVLIYVLLGAAVLSLFLGDYVESAAILVIALLNAVLGYVQESRAEKALAALQSMSAPSANVLRDGAPHEVPAGDVVPGDVLLLEAGDIVPADARLIEVSGMSTSEALLTGESVPEGKAVQPVSEDTPLADQTSMIFQGTTVTRGRGSAIVVATGAATEMGRIAASVGGRQDRDTPLQKELAHVGRYLAAAAGGLSIVVFAVGVARGIELEEMLLTAASLAVAAIPEGLPAASTVVLALGVQRMAARNAIVRRLSSVETLGSVNVVFTDKTGTLTQNRMRVERTWVASGERDLVRIARLCNNATLGQGVEPDSGDPTEIALLRYAVEASDDAGATSSVEREGEVPFDAERARMTVVVRTSEGGRQALVKGAAQALLERCSRIGPDEPTEARRQEVLQQAAAMGREGMRVLALAMRNLADEPIDETLENGLTLAGLLGMRDPLRPEAHGAVREAQDAGIRVVMVTGDQQETAAAIAEDVGINGTSLTGRDIELMEQDRLAEALDDAGVFSRVTSEHKLSIVRAARAHGSTVAMTGDGVNDAPALQAADIGVAMGKAGTDVAREASDMVLADDNFSTIVAAVEEGRTIHANIRRFIHFLLSCNAAEVLVIFLVLVAAGVTALTPLQILFVNLLTDGLPALALGVEPASPGVMQRKPRPSGEGLLTASSLTPILGIGGLIAASSLAAYALGERWGDGELARTLTFATLVGAQLASSLVFRSEYEPVHRLPSNNWLWLAIGLSVGAVLLVLYTPFLQDVFETSTLSLRDWAAVVLLSLVPLVVSQAVKLSGLLDRLNLIPRQS